ncbi:hypothetical protein [Paraburkholderia fungorum]|uniref:hypothetical protein n=1 Tax=Paraburkholderia fungorum TaxID=134537 RepID=UPI003D6AD562
MPATAKRPALATAQSVPFEPKTAALLAAGAKPFHWDEVTHYASEGHAGATMLFADIERTSWIKTALHTAAEGELVISWDSRPHSRVTWAQPVAAVKKAA